MTRNRAARNGTCPVAAVSGAVTPDLGTSLAAAGAGAFLPSAGRVGEVPAGADKDGSTLVVCSESRESSGRAATGSGALARLEERVASGRMTEKVDPRPGADRRIRRWSSSVTRRRTIDNPSPRPLLRSRSGLASCTNSWKMASWAAGAMPEPLSRTSIRRCSRSAPQTRAATSTVPVSV